MPRASQVKCIALVLVLACQKEAAEERNASRPAEALASAQLQTRVRRPALPANFECKDLRPPPATEHAAIPETIELGTLGAGNKLVLSKTGVVVTFDRDECLRAARCLKLQQAIAHLEAETGQLPEMPLFDAFQLSFVAAALLDAGRASVRLEDEKELRKSIVRDGWAADGCGGRCRSFGRLYRVSEEDSFFFLRISDGPLTK